MIILASTSPRRQALLKEIVSEFKAVEPLYQEELLSHLSPHLQVQHLAVNKALSISSHDDDIIISGDTIVELNGELLGKPKDENEAMTMLMKMNGKTHSVLSALCVMKKDRTLIQTFETKVTLRNVDKAILEEYIKRHQPFDKAGSYGVQDNYFKENILLDYSGYLNTVIGFPIEGLAKMLKEIEND